jgi:hypothetical protein
MTPSERREIWQDDSDGTNRYMRRVFESMSAVVTICTWLGWILSEDTMNFMLTVQAQACRDAWDEGYRVGFENAKRGARS